MNQSPEIKDLVAALCSAQSVMQPAKFNKINPFHKNKYADFNSVREACQKPLAANGLSFMQCCETIDGKLMLVTMLAHTSGQWIKSSFPLIAKTQDSQGVGSAMTYAKRYSLSAMLGIVADDDDDDANEACDKTSLPSSSINPARLRAFHEKLSQLPGLKESMLAYVYKNLGINDFAKVPETMFANLEKDVEQRFKDIKVA